MQENQTTPSGEHLAISRRVSDIYKTLHDTVMTQTISPEQLETCVMKLKRNSVPGNDGRR